MFLSNDSIHFSKGNIQRSQLVVEQLGDSRKSMVKVSGDMSLLSWVSFLSFIVLFLMPISEERLYDDVSEIQA